jgi:hypothetical protein
MSTPTLLDVNLQQVPNPYLLGKWRVVNKVLSREDPASALAQATKVDLQPQMLHLDGEGGQWSALRC